MSDDYYYSGLYAKEQAEAEARLAAESESNSPIKYYKRGGVIYAVHGTSSINFVERLLAEIADLTAAQEPSVPEGWVMVPLQPTEGMKAAGCLALGALYGHYGAEECWKAMLAAALCCASAAQASGKAQPDAGLDVEAVLTELLNRIAASQGAPVLIGADELADWPAEAVAAMQSQGVITRARPAVSAVCPGCERECVMPVYTPPGAGHAAGAFIVCDKRSDINRVSVPLDRLEQWQVSGDSIAAMLAGLLGLHRSGADTASEGRWEIGIFKGSKHAVQKGGE